MTSTKRPLSPDANADRGASKRQVTGQPTPPEDEDELAEILTRIQQHEESEALARKLQEEWDGSSSMANCQSGRSDSSYTNMQSPHKSPMLVHEDDEAFARRLAAQWAEEDHASFHDTPQASTSSSKQPRCDTAVRNATICCTRDKIADDTPTAKLDDFRELFVGSRECTKCAHELLSPRGYVRILLRLPWFCSTLKDIEIRSYTRLKLHPQA